MSTQNYKFKICLFGPASVGKTSLLLRYIKDYFSDSLKKTIGSNFLIKDVKLNDKSVRLLLWDIGGQAQFHKLRSIYFKGSNAAIGVFALDDPESLLKIPGWISSIKKSVKKNIPMILLGNKNDLEREVDMEEVKKMAEKMECKYMETSAKTGENVEEAFQQIAIDCLSNLENS
ncbi:MAG: GTP-binding protein [Candidatus Lokiarchaeota archaeon]|nr:GTP-binding protein [Candidatus Lokiarchaeota archaeon]